MDWTIRRLGLLAVMVGSRLPITAGQEFVTIDLGNYKAFLCPDGTALPGGMQITTCAIAECDPHAVLCVTDVIPQNQCNATDKPLPKTLTTPIKYQFTNMMTSNNESPNIYAVEYACEAGMVWLSGHIGSHFSTCVDGRWTPVNDICSNIEILPSDCSEIYSLGMNETAWYPIFPLGQLLKGATQAFCKLDADNPGDNGWTTILFYADAKAFVNYTMLEDFDTGSIFNSYLNETEKPYFIGIENLYFLTRNSSGERPLVIQFLGFNKMGFYHATYDEFLVDEVEEIYTLTSVGNYHGNTGDAFRLNLNWDYLDDGTETDFGWFAKQDIPRKAFTVNTKKALYGSLPTPILTHLQIRVRPKEFDNAVACPLVVPMEYLEPWENTVVNLPTSRAPGVVFSYTCNFLYMEGIEGKNRTSSGAVECLDDVDGEPPHWNASVTLPCTFACPNGYTLRHGIDDSEIATVCYKVSAGGHPLGFFGAARSCGKDGATLAPNPDVAFLTEMGLMDADIEYEFYYTAHAQRGTSSEMTPTLDAKCVGSCKPKPSTECVTVSGTGAYKSKSCYLQQMKYICVLPGICPDGYTYFKGMCLNASPAANMMSAMLGCQESGGGLFVPESLDAISKVQEFLSTTESIGDTFFLGSNDVFGNWTQNGYYNPDDEVVEWLGEDPDNHWRLLEFDGGLEYMPVPYLMDPMSEKELYLEYHGVICEYPGPMGCLQDPPETLQNMEFKPKIYDGEIDPNEGSYQCNEGFYLDESYTKTEKHIECYSQLGGWNLGELPTCFPSKCLEAPPDPLVKMTYDFDMNSARVYEAGEMIEYTCDPNFVVTYTTKNPAQNISCHGIESGWREDELTPCLPSMCEEPPPLPFENMDYPHIENTTYVLGDKLDYRCDLGHFVNGDVNLTLQFLECNGMLYEWPLDELAPCLPIEVCLEGPPEGNYSISWDSLSRYYGGQVEALCYPGMQTWSGMTVQYFNCSYLDDEEMYGFLLLNLEECDVCADELVTANATTDWATQETWMIGEMVKVTCEEGYELDIQISIYFRPCTLYGWSGTLPCYRVCAEDLPVVEGMDMTTPFDNRIGAQLTFECFDGLYIPTEKYLPAFATATNVTCNSDFEWVLQDEPLACVTLCPDKPTVENTTVVWDEMRLWMKKHVIEVTCTAHHVFAFGKTSKKVSCTEEGWETIVGCHEACTSQPPEGRNMTMEMTENVVGTILEYTCTDELKVQLIETYQDVTDMSHVVCAPDLTWKVVGRPLICEELVENPPKVNISRAYLGFSEGPYYRGQNLPLYCEDGLLSPKAKNSSIITNTVNGWEMLDPEFGCHEVTFMLPYQMAVGSTIKDYVNPPYVLNQILEVTCNPQFISNTGRRSTSYTFTQNGWVASEPHFRCLPGKARKKLLSWSQPRRS